MTVARYSACSLICPCVISEASSQFFQLPGRIVWRPARSRLANWAACMARSRSPDVALSPACRIRPFSVSCGNPPTAKTLQCCCGGCCAPCSQRSEHCHRVSQCAIDRRHCCTQPKVASRGPSRLEDQATRAGCSVCSFTSSMHCFLGLHFQNLSSSSSLRTKDLVLLAESCAEVSESARKLVVAESK